MIQYRYQVRFDTPAFLGNAEQTAQWRTPPFKALLRQWWRVAFSAGRHAHLDVGEMRRQEGLLFGVAADGREGSRKSQIRIRLDRWDIGAETKNSWGKLESASNTKVKHPEVGSIGPLLYLGYGPLEVSKIHQAGKPPVYVTVLKKNAAIQFGEKACLSLAFPAANKDQITTALWLVHHFGTLGGRSRNGWGSFALTPVDDATPRLDGPLETALLHDWQRALTLDWPHAIGCGDDRRPLIWSTPTCSDWKTLMRQLAEIKIGLRTQFMFPKAAPPHPKPLDRHWLSYPVTKHAVKPWGRNLRLPNSLRFKARRDDKNQLSGVIVHVPCAPPAAFRPDLKAIEDVWSRVYRFLDDPANGLTRIPA
jgi:CRISPR-associated protein Cmr1